MLLRRLRAWKIYWESRPQKELVYMIYIWFYIYLSYIQVPFDAGNMVASLYHSKKTWLFLLSYILMKARSDQKMEYRCYMLHLGCSCHILTLQARQSFKVFCTSLWVMNCFPAYNPFSHRLNIARFSLLYHYRYFHHRCLGKLHSFFPPVQTLTVTTYQSLSVL